MAQRNLTPDKREEQDAYGDPTLNAGQLHDAETSAGDNGTDGQDQYDATVRDSQGDSGAALKAREEKSGAGAINYENVSQKVQRGKQIFKGAANIRKLGPLGAVVVFVIGGALVTLASFPALVLQHVEETLTHALSDADPSINVRTKLLFKLKVDATKNAFAESADGKCDIKCKFSTINDKTRKRMEASKGVKFELEKKAFGRYVIKSMTFPAVGNKPAVTVTNGNDFAAAVKDPVHAGSFYKVFNPSADPFLSYNFVARLKERFNLDKKIKLTGETDKENKTQLARNLGIDENANAAVDPKATPEEKAAAGATKEVAATVDAGKLKIGAKANDVAGAVCAAYDVGKAVNVAYSTYKVAQFASLFLTIANTASNIRTGKATPSAANVASNIVTKTDDAKQYSDNGVMKANPYFGKTFTDSAGYKAANYADDLALSARDKQFSLNPTGVSGLIGKLTGFLNPAIESNPAILVGASQTCNFANSPGGVALSCLPEVAAGSVVPVAGNIGAFIVCIGTGLVVGEVIGLAIQTILPGIIQDIVKNDIGTITANLVGPGAGNAAYVGGGEILGSGMASMYGMTPGTSNEVNTYKVATAKIRSDYAAAQRANAADTPLDVTNQYSFLGSFIRSSGVLDAKLSSSAGVLGWVGALSSSATAAIIPRTHAVASEALLYKDGADCPDTGLQEIGVACNSFGLPSFTMTAEEMNADISDTVDLMTDPASNDGVTPFIDAATGDATPGTDYAKFMDYCANRKVNYGQTTGSIADEDFAWETGYACTCTEDKVDGVVCTDELAAELHVFRTYTMDKTLNDSVDDEQVTLTAAAGSTGCLSNADIQYGTPEHPYATNSPWNTPIACNPAIDPASDAINKTTIQDQTHVLNMILYAFGQPVYTSTANTPYFTIGGSVEHFTFPKDPTWLQNAGADAKMNVIDTKTEYAYELQGCDKGCNNAYWGVKHNYKTGLADGYPPPGELAGPTGSHMSQLAGMVRISDINSGSIEHALSFITGDPQAGVWRYPAAGTDGKRTAPNGIAEGMRLQLDPSINVDAIPGIGKGEAMIAKALQKYGAFCTDTGGGNNMVAGFYAEKPTTTADPYPGVGWTDDWAQLPHIPRDKIRVLAESATPRPGQGVTTQANPNAANNGGTAAAAVPVGGTGGAGAGNGKALANQGTVHEVGGFSQGAIQAAINAAKAGDTVHFKAGTYPINSTITLKAGVLYKGDKGAILHGTSTISIFNTGGGSNNTKVDGLTFDNGNFDIGGDGQVSNGMVIVNNTVQNLAGKDYGRQQAFFIHSLANSQIDYNTFTNLGLQDGPTETEAIAAYGLTNVSISHNAVVGAHQGMHLDPTGAIGSGNGVVVNGNVMRGLFRMGIEVFGNAYGLKIQNNEMSNWSPLNNRNNNKIALSIVPNNSNGTEISGNYLHAPEVTDEPAIEYRGTNGSIHDNRLVGFGDAISISGSSGSKFYNNNISGFHHGAFGRDGGYTADHTIGSNTINGKQQTGYNL